MVDSDLYKTVEGISEGLYKDKGSRFISYCYHVSSEFEIKKILDQLKKQYYDASHHVYAYRYGIENQLFRANDDGEPSNSSGKPVLGQILSYNLTNVLIVVIRYYGGVNLGVSGLINAYKSAAIEALENAKIVEKCKEINFNFKFDYSIISTIMRVIKKNGVKINNQEFNNNEVSIFGVVKNNQFQLLCDEIISESKGVNVVIIKK